MSALSDPANIGRLVAVLVFSLAAVKCFQVARKERVQSLCLIALGLALLNRPASALPLVDQGSRPLLMLALIVGFGLACAAVVLAAVGLFSCRRDRALYDRGRAQGIWAVILGTLFLVQSGWVMSRVALTPAGPPVRPVAADQSAAHAGRYVLADYNLSFANPGAAWLEIDHASINPDLKLMLRRRQPELFLMVIPEIYGADTPLQLADFGGVLRSTFLRGGLADTSLSEPVAATAAGIPGEAMNGQGTMGANRLHYEYWYGLHQGVSVQVIAYGLEEHAAQVRRHHQAFLQSMRFEDPERVFVAHGEVLREPVTLAAEGVRVELPPRQWMSTALDEFPEAAFSAKALDGGFFNVLRADLHSLEPDLQAVASAVLALQGLEIEQQRVISQRDSQLEDGTRQRELVLTLVQDEQPYEDHYRIQVRDGRVLVTNVWNPGPPRASWQPQSLLSGGRWADEPPPLAYPLMSAERRSAQASFINHMGLSYYRRGLHMQALPFFRLAASIDPDDAVISGNSLHAYWEAGDLPKALAEAERQVRRFPGDLNAQADRAALLQELDMPAEAAAAYATLFEQPAEDDDALLKYLNLLIDLDRANEARGLIDREVERRPHRKLRLWQVQVARIEGDRDGAEKLLRRLADDHGWDSSLFEEIFTLCEEKGDDAALLVWLDRQVAQLGPSFDAWMRRGESQARLGRLEAARVSYTEALALQPEQADAMARLAQLDAQMAEAE